MVAHPRPCRRGQGGFALIAGLVLWMLVCGVTLVALLSMTLTGSRTSAAQAVDSRQSRAADSALEAAVNQIRMDGSGAIGAPTSADDGTCQTGLGSSGSGLDYEDQVGTSVTVTAECLRSPQLTPRTDSGENPNAAKQLDVVGGSYRSASDLPDTVRWKTDCTGAADSNCYPWRLGIGGPNYLAQKSVIEAQSPTFLHTSDPAVASGSSTLEVSGDLNVAGQALPLVNPPGSDDAVGLTVGGSFKQGSVGLFDSVGGQGSCGVLGPSFPWNVKGARIIDSNDTAGVPECGVVVNTTEPGPPSSPLLLPTRSVPSCAGAAGSVIPFDSGRYRKDQTTALNDLLGGACPGRVFWFKPGDYWFDVDDSTNSVRERNSLIIDDPTVRVIFGQPSGGDAAAATFPDACDRSVPGVSITLSARTSFRHKQGQVAVCDRSASTAAGNLPPALYQSAGSDGGWSGTPDPGQSSFTLTADCSAGWFNSCYANAPTQVASGWTMDGQNASATWGCTLATLFGASCTANASVTAGAIGTSGPAPTGATATEKVASLDLLLKASATNDSGSWTLSLLSSSDSSTRIQFYKAGASTPSCAVGFPGLPDPLKPNFQNTLAFDLFSSQGETVSAGASNFPRCDSLRGQLTRSDLYGAKVVVTYHMKVSLAAGVTATDSTVSLDGVELRAGWDLTPTAAANGSGWNNAENIRSLDGLSTGYTLGGCPAFGSCATATRSMTMTGFDNLDSPYVPTDGSLLKAGVVVTGETTDQNFFTNGSFIDLTGRPDVSDGSWMEVTVNLVGGGSCTAYWDRIPFWGQGVYLDLLGAPGSCASTLTTASQLAGASASLQVHIERNSWGAWVNYGTRIDHLKISTVSGGNYLGPQAANLLTEDFGSNASARTSVNVFGPVSTSKNDLNVQWLGPAPTRSDGSVAPTIGGRTVVAAIGSFVGADGEAGVLCCTPVKPAERVVVLRAKVLQSDGSYMERGTATVRVRDVGTNGSAVIVDRWDVR